MLLCGIEQSYKSSLTWCSIYYIRAIFTSHFHACAHHLCAFTLSVCMLILQGFQGINSVCFGISILISYAHSLCHCPKAYWFYSLKINCVFHRLRHVLGLSFKEGGKGLSNWNSVIRGQLISCISMGYCKKDVTPVHYQWSYAFLALTHWYTDQPKYW